MKNRLLWLLGLLIPVAIIASFWIPPLAHYRVASPRIEQSMLDRLRTVPAETQLIEIERQNLALPLRMSNAEIMDAAARLLAGELALKGFPAVAIAPGFDQADLRKGLPTWGLHFSSLAGTEILARVYEITHDDRWLEVALQHALGFIEHERTAWLPDGFLWNDHAIAGRVSVLIKLWRLYRKHPDYDPASGRRLIEHILRCRNLLAKDSQFTFNTNHGVMQNISLLQIAAAFPGLPDEQHFRRLAQDRLDRQLRFYVSPEGVVLEHSAEYHALGIELIGMATSLLPILNEPVPPQWRLRHRQAQEFLDLIRLPDDTLPMFGNTNSTPDFPPEKRRVHDDERSSCAAREGLHLYPVAGYAVRWSCGHHTSQSVMALSQFVGHGHKHADELSLLTWTRGSRWLTSVGYWPYGVAGDEQAYGWEGSNAPHWPGETTIGEREPLLLASGNTGGITFVDAQRQGPGGSEFRRQVLQIGEDWWIVLDFAKSQTSAEAEVLWTFFPGITLAARGDGAYRASQGTNEMLVNIVDNGRINHRMVMGERSPWRGWVVKDRVPAPAATLLSRFPAGVPLVSSFRAAEGGESDDIKIDLLDEQGPEVWRLAIDIGGGHKVNIARQSGGYIELTGIEHLGDTRLQLTSAADVRAERAIIRAAYSELGADYPRYREVFHYRLKVTKLLLAIFAGQEILLALIWIFRRPLLPAIRLCQIVAWIGGGLALHLWYFP